ncbi:MAG: hypothetical protein ACI9OE_002473 [Mariniflexile sp.]|jgi:hypothetical protein
MKNISLTSQITFVIQGKYSDNGLVEDIIKFYPGSPIIISCWRADDVKKYSHDNDIVILKNVDPGGFKYKRVYLNVNRQITSSLNGLNRANTKYSVKIRSDMRIFDSSILKILTENTYLPRDNYIFQNWISISNLTTVNVNKIKRPFSYCDWIYVGKTIDLIKLFDIPLFPEEYFLYNEQGIKNEYGFFTMQKFNAEQWVIINCLEKYLLDNDITVKEGFHFNKDIEAFNNYILANCFRVYDNKSLGVYSSKYNWFNFAMQFMLTESDWKINYHNVKKCVFFNIPLIDFPKLLYKIASYDFIRKIVKLIKK